MSKLTKEQRIKNQVSKWLRLEEKYLDIERIKPGDYHVGIELSDDSEIPENWINEVIRLVVEQEKINAIVCVNGEYFNTIKYDSVEKERAKSSFYLFLFWAI